MSTLGNIELNISEDAVKYANIISLSIQEEEKRRRSFLSIAALDTFADYLVSQDVNVSISKNLFKIAPINAEFEMADIYYNGWKLDIRVVGDDNVLTVPQVHFKSGITPDFYVAVKVDEKLEKVVVLGYVDSADINKKSKKGDYYVVDFAAFLPNEDLINKIKTKNDIAVELTDHDDFEGYYLAYLDNEISAKDKKRLIKHLVNCKQCREAFVEFFDFETIVSNSEKYPEIFEDQTLGVVGAVEANDAKYDGQEVVINLNQNDDEILDGLFANSVPQNTVAVEPKEEEEPISFPADDEEAKEDEPEIEELAEELLEQDLDEEDSSEEEFDFVIDDDSEDSLDEGLEDFAEELAPVDEMVQDDLAEMEASDEPEKVEETLEESFDEGLDFIGEEDSLEEFDFSTDDSLEEDNEFSLDISDSEDLKLDELEELPIEAEEDVAKVEDAIVEDTSFLEEVSDETLIEELREESSEVNDEAIDFIVDEPIEPALEIEEEEASTLDSEPLTEVEFETTKETKNEDGLEEFDFLDDVDSLPVAEKLDEEAPETLESEPESGIEEFTPVEEAVEPSSEPEASSLEEFTLDDLESLTPEQNEEVVEEQVEADSVEDSENDYSFLESDDYSETDAVNESQMEEISEQDLDDILTGDSDDSFYEDAFGESDEDRPDSGFEEFGSEENSSDDTLVFDDSFGEVDSTEGSSSDEDSESNSGLSSLNLDELVLDDNTPAEETVIPSAFKEIEKPESSDKKKKLTILMSAVVGCLLLATILGASLLISGNSKKTKDANTEVASQLDDRADLFSLAGDSTKEEVDILKKPLAKTPKDMNKVMTNVFSETPSSVTVTKIAWEVPQSFAVNDMFKEFLQVSGKNLQVNLKSDLIDATEFAYNDKIKVNIAVKPDGEIKDIKVLGSSGSTQIDNIIVKSIKETMDYINIPTIEQSKANVKNKIYNLKLVINF